MLVDATRYQISNREQGTRKIRQLVTKLLHGGLIHAGQQAGDDDLGVLTAENVPVEQREHARLARNALFSRHFLLAGKIGRIGAKVAARELDSTQEILRRGWYRSPFAAHQGDRLQQLGFSLLEGSFASLLVGLVKFE